MTEKDIVDVFNEVKLKKLIRHFTPLLGKTEKAKSEFFAKVSAVAELEKVDVAGETVTFLVLKPDAIAKYGRKRCRE